MHAANEKACMKYINFSAMTPTTMAFNATSEMVACMHLSKAEPYKREHACDAERPNKPGQREYGGTLNFWKLASQSPQDGFV